MKLDENLKLNDFRNCDERVSSLGVHLLEHLSGYVLDQKHHGA